MPFRLDDTDIAVLESLLKDGRKSFRQISREISVSTPTVKQRYEKLVNMGLIKAVIPVIDLGMIENKAAHHASRYTRKSTREEFTLLQVRTVFETYKKCITKHCFNR